MLIQSLRPNVLVKGGDYRLDEIVGSAIIRGWGGVVRIYPIEIGHSTTSIIQKLDSGNLG